MIVIVGAGPAGLQLGYFLQKAGLDYLILERNSQVASFFTVYPHSGKLISINKPNTGKTDPDFNLRHDWNSLLSDDDTLIFPSKYSTDYYPDHADLVRYMSDFATKHSLKIQFNTEVVKITPEYTLETKCNGETKIYTCEKLVIATGLSKPIYPSIQENTVVKIKHYGDFEKDHFKKPEVLETYRNKSLLIIGNGNSGYELANLLTPYCSSITINGRNPKEWAASSHYAGDLRSVYLPFLDTFLLKSLNALNTGLITNTIIEQETIDSQYKLFNIQHTSYNHVKYQTLKDSISGYDHVIYCTGWRFDDSIFHFPIHLTRDRKYPNVTPEYESTSSQNLFFIGSLMHSLDFKTSSGGFIHGFRYLIKHFMNLHFDHQFDMCRFTFDTLLSHIIKKINTSSALYQMYGYMCDMFYMENGEIIYYNNVTIPFFDNRHFKPDNQYAILTLEYGSKKITKTDEFGRLVSSIGKESASVLLHPVLRILNKEKLIDEVHFDEDLYANFSSNDKYVEKMKRTLRMFL